MAVLNKMSGNTDTENSGYPGLLTNGSSYNSNRVWPSEKYYDLYTTVDTKTACGGSPCKGHALNEVTGWYGDAPWIVSTTKPWFVHSGDHVNVASTGVFTYGSAFGHALYAYSFRQVLTPNN